MLHGFVSAKITKDQNQAEVEFDDVAIIRIIVADIE